MNEHESRMGTKYSDLSRLTLSAALLCASSLEAQPTIEHGDVNCLPRGEFTQFLASIKPPSTVRAAKIYFRSNLYPEFYFVAMNLDATGTFEAVLPIPSAETMKVVYYFEAIDVSFQIARSEELEVSVSEDESCSRGPGAVLYPGANPAIVVGATQLAAPAIPAGFQATGITGFLTASGGIATGGGGIGVGVAVGAAAGAAAGVGVIVANGGDSGSGTTTAPATGGNTTSIPPATTSIPPAGTTTTSPSGSTTTTVPSSTTTVSPTPTTAPPSLTACFTWESLGGCKVNFDSCSTPVDEISRYEWRLLGPPLPGPPPESLPSVTVDFMSDPRCRNSPSFNVPVRLTVYASSGRSDSVQHNVTVLSAPAYRTTASESATVSFVSQLLALPRDGSARGQIVINGSLLSPSNNASPSRHDVRLRAGIVRIEVTLTTPIAPGSLWELDFSSTAGLESGSLRAESGSVAAADERRVVFRLNGDRGETFRLRLEIR